MTKPKSKAIGRDPPRPHDPQRIDKVELCSVDSFPASDPPGWINSNQGRRKSPVARKKPPIDALKAQGG
jgi:hypothetical protein